MHSRNYEVRVKDKEKAAERKRAPKHSAEWNFLVLSLTRQMKSEKKMEKDFEKVDKTWELQEQSTAKLDSFQDGDKGNWYTC